MSAQASAPRSPDLPLNDFALALEKCIGKLSGQIKHCGRSAFLHLRRSWRLKGIDNEMAMFRMITSEEEAATALILAVQKRGYPNAQLLNHQDHRHKASLYPFLSALAPLLAPLKLTVGLNHSNRAPHARIMLDFNALTGIETDTPRWVEPEPPLHMIVGCGDRSCWFESALETFATAHGQKSLPKIVRDDANLRNRILYASSEGVPVIERLDDALILQRLHHVVVLLTLVVIVEQTKQHQAFVTQCIEALVQVHKRSGWTPFDLSSVEQSAVLPTIIVSRTGSKSEVSVVSTFTIDNAARLLVVQKVVVSAAAINFRMIE